MTTVTTRRQADLAIIEPIIQARRDAIALIHTEFLKIFAEAMEVGTSLIFVLQAPRHTLSTTLAMRLAADWHRTEDVLFFCTGRLATKKTAQNFLNPKLFTNNQNLGLVSEVPYVQTIQQDGGTRVTVAPMSAAVNWPVSAAVRWLPQPFDDPKDLVICDCVTPPLYESVWTDNRPLVIIDSGCNYPLPRGHQLITDLFSSDVNGKDNIADEDKKRYHLRIYQKNKDFLQDLALEDPDIGTTFDNEKQSE